MKPTDSLDEIIKESEQVVGEEVLSFYTRLVKTSPTDTGHFKLSWKVPEQRAKLSWVITNTAEYASILANGRYHALGRWYGSLQWAGGLAPMISKTKNLIQGRLNVIEH